LLGAPCVHCSKSKKYQKKNQKIRGPKNKTLISPSPVLGFDKFTSEDSNIWQ